MGSNRDLTLVISGESFNPGNHNEKEVTDVHLNLQGGCFGVLV